MPYRAVLRYAPGRTATSATASVTSSQTPVTQAVDPLQPAAAATTTRGACTCSATRLAAGEATADWPHATPFEGTDSFGVLHEIGIADDTKRVGFIVHGNGDTGGNPDAKDPAGAPDRFFIPLSTPEIWLRQGDVRIYSCPAADSTCVVPSAASAWLIPRKPRGE